jgi:hypothetical protein
MDNSRPINPVAINKPMIINNAPEIMLTAL